MDGDIAAVALAALGIALSPVPFLLAAALLGSTKSTQTAAAFVTGEAFAVALVAAAVVFLVPARAGAEVGVPVATLEIAIGVVLALLLAVDAERSRRGRAARWWSRLGSVGPRTAFGSGLAMVVVNPKNLALTLAGSAAIVRVWSSSGARMVSVLMFTATAVSLLLALIAVATTFPERAETMLERAQAFALDHERVLVTVLLGSLAAFFLARGVVGSVA